MFEKNLKFAYLLDFYGSVLDEHTEAVMKAYYDDDLSLAEVAEGVGISRQGVRHIIKRGEDQLEFLESKLHLAERHESTESALERIRAIGTSLLSGEISAGDAASALESAADIISENN